MRLNLDIFIEISYNLSSSADISRVSRSSRALRALGIKLLLQRGVIITNKKRYASFIEFMTTDPDHRAPLVKYLYLKTEKQDLGFGGYTEQMAQILERCPSVEALTLIDGYVLDIDVRVGAALSRLEQIKDLRLFWVGGVVNLNQVLACMRSKCVKVELSYCKSLGKRINTDDYDPTIALAACSSSLEVLALTSPRLLRRKPTIYPHLTTLTLSSLHSDFDITPVLHAFPNLRRLVLSESWTLNNEEDVRTRNTLSFEQNAWTKLDYCEGSVDALYALGINCPIHRIVIDADSYISLRHSPRRLSQLLKTAQVTRLSMSPTLKGGTTLLESLFEVVKASSPSVLTHFAIDSYMMADCNAEDLDRMLTKLEDCSKTLGLRYLQLAIRLDDRLGIKLEPDTLVARFFASTPTLRYFIWGLFGREQGWMAHRHEGNLLVETLAADGTKRIKLEEGMDDIYGLVDWV